MDSGTLRLILLIAGLLLLYGIYYFGQKKQDEVKKQARDNREQQPQLDEPVDEPEETSWAVDEEPAIDNLEQELEQLDDIVHELETPLRATEETVEAELEKPVLDVGIQQELFEDHSQQETVLERDLPQKILQINIISHAGHFDGESIMQLARQNGLQPGDMEIFHRYSEKNHDKTLFSMASMVEPGTFPFDALDQFSTPGLVLFAQLPGPKSGLEIYEEMLTAARHLAEKLNGVLQDETHSVLSKQTIEHTKEEIMEYQRKIKLAGSTL